MKCVTIEKHEKWWISMLEGYIQNLKREFSGYNTQN